jgi:hypothetical protein
MMARGKPFKTNWELDIARSDNILNLEVGKLCIKAGPSSALRTLNFK